MNSVQHSYSTFSEVVSDQKLAGDTRYRLLNYCIDVPVSTGHLLFNTLSCELIYLDNSEYRELHSNEYLVKHWFLVPTKFDDKRFVSQTLEVIKLFTSTNKHRYNFTIFTTTDCNARCFYCFQKGITHNFLSQDTADKIIEYLLNQYNTNLKPSGQKLLLQWFGGEPLFNHKIITYICEKLSSSGAEYKSQMISNGYLFDAELADIAHDLWHLKRVQITLDGTEPVYNRVKNYIYKDVNAYQRVLDNIEHLLSSRINVKVRLNTDAYNAADLMNLVSQLAQKFAGRRGFSCYARALFEQNDKKFTQRTDQQRTLVFQKLRELDNKILENNIGSFHVLPTQPRMVFCKADANNGFTIAPDGRMGVCDYYTESNFVTHIDHPDTIDQTVIQSFKQQCEDLPICNDCPLYPQCIRLKMCGEENICFTQMKEYKLDNMRLAVLHAYNKWKNKQQSDKVNDDIEDITEIGNC